MTRRGPARGLPVGAAWTYREQVPETHATTVTRRRGRPNWLTGAPKELRPILEIGYEKFGDDPAAIAAWIGRLHDYKQFWNIVEAEPADLEERYARDEQLQAQISEGRAHPEKRVARPSRRTA